MDKDKPTFRASVELIRNTAQVNARSENEKDLKSQADS